MATIGVEALKKLVNGATWMTADDKKAAINTLERLRDDYNARNGGTAPTPTPVQQSVFALDGWMAVRFDKLPTPAELSAVGIKWVAAIVNHGANPDGSHALDPDDHANHAWFAQGKDDPYRAAGIKVGAWGWNQGFFPAIEAWMAAETIKVYGLDLFITNGENDWKGNDLPDQWARAMQAELAARALPATFPVAWSTLGAAAGEFIFPFHYSAFTSRGWHILPQAYPQESGEYTLLRKGDNQGVIEHSQDAGIPRNMVHPTIANYPARTDKPGAFKPTIDQWIADIRSAQQLGVVGISLWAHDWSPAEYTKLLAAI